MSTSIASTSLDDLFSRMPTGSLDRAILNNLRGFNHRQTENMLPSNRDMPGYLFFTRPQLNLQKDNIRNLRQMSQLLTNQPLSMQSFVRSTLDPRVIAGLHFMGQTIPGVPNRYFDNEHHFIPVLTNNWTSISGWPSATSPTFKSKAGLYNESFVMVDGRFRNSEAFDLTVNFRNTRGDPVLFMFYIWGFYMSAVFEGLLVPYLDYITDNMLDYCTRIYHIEMDHTKRYVTKMAAVHAAIPVGYPIGDAFNVSKNQTYTEANKEISMTFSCVGVDYFDPILILEFNESVCIGNPAMEDGYREQSMVKLNADLVGSFNFRGFPRINPNTSELEWYVRPEEYKLVISKYLRGVAATAQENEQFEGD